MKAEEEFDDIFRKKTEEANFNLRQSDWEKVRRQIDEQRLAEYQSVSGINYWIVSAIALLGSAALIYLAIPDNGPAAGADEVVYQSEQQLLQTTPAQAEPLSLATLPQPGSSSDRTEQLSDKMSASTPLSKVRSQSTPPQIQNNLPSSKHGNAEPGIDQDQKPIPAENGIVQVEKEIENSTVENQVIKVLWPKEGRLTSNHSEEVQLRNSNLFLSEETDYVVNKTNPHSVNAEFGLMYDAGMTESDLFTGEGLNIFGGLNYSRMLGNKWSLSMGAQLYNLQGMDKVFYQNSSNDFGFGSTQTQTVLTCHSMLFVSFPLRVYYHPDQKHSVSFGLHAGSLLMAKNTLEVIQLSDGQVQQYSSEKQNGIYENMNSANFLVSAGLHKSIQERVNLQVEVYYGLSDLFADSGQPDHLQNSSGIRIGLSYRFTGK